MAVLKYKSSTGEYKPLVNYNITGLTPVQSTGNSTSEVMSQYAVTAALSEKMSSNDVERAINMVIYGEESPSVATPLVTSEDLAEALAGYVQSSALKTVATSGSYNDLDDTPDIPSGAAASKGVDTSLTASSTSTNLPTSKAVATLVKNAVNEATYNSGHSTSTNIASVPVTKRLSIVTISANGSLNLNDSLADGQELHVIVKNGSASDITVTIPTAMASKDVVQMSGDKLTVAGNGYADINIVFDGTNYYVRAL